MEFPGKGESGELEQCPECCVELSCVELSWSNGLGTVLDHLFRPQDPECISCAICLSSDALRTTVMEYLQHG